MDRKQIADNGTILRAAVGSHLFGLNTPESDVDEMGVCVEPMSAVAGFSQFEQYETKHPDLTVYGLRKYLSLALNGNPTILMLLFAPKDMCGILTREGVGLQKLADKIVSMKAGKAFLGYMKAQREKILGLRGKDVYRPELVEKHGFDTKFAMHMLRLGFQGVELLSTGKVTLPMQGLEKDLLLNVRHGKVPLAECVTLAEELESALKFHMDNPKLQPEPDTAYVEQWMLDIYAQSWNGDL